MRLIQKTMILSAVFVLFLSGCFFKSGEELYSLPKPSKDYLDLQNAIDVVLNSGAEYSAPVSGSSRQAVQLIDLDGDGEDEAVAFFKISGEKPLKVYIFKKVNDSYENVAVIEGDGTAFDSVEYARLGDSGMLEIIIGWQVSDQVYKALSVYSLQNFEAKLLLATSYSEYLTTDLDGNGVKEVFLLRYNSDELNGVAELYAYEGDDFRQMNQAALSAGMESIRRVRSGYLVGNIPAVFVAGVYEKTGIVTDIFAIKDGMFGNISIPEGSDISLETVRNYIIYAIDIDEDGILELPKPKQLPSYQAEEGADSYWIIIWYNYTINRQTIKKMITYHNYSDGWYLALPDQWEDQITVSRKNIQSSQRALVFSIYNGEETPPEDIVTIYTLTGDNRFERAALNGRFILESTNDTIYAAEFASSKWEEEIGKDELIKRFHIIRSEWSTGET